jgi:cell division protein FtsI/penicillin-binding protein 2
VIEQIRNSPDNKNKGDADAGAVIMLDVRTGAVLAMVSYRPTTPTTSFCAGTTRGGRARGAVPDRRGQQADVEPRHDGDLRARLDLQAGDVGRGPAKRRDHALWQHHPLQRT